MKASRTAVLLVGGALALGLVACGGGGSSTASGSGSSAPESSTASPSTQSGTPEKAKKVAPASAQGGLTPPGTKLKFGEAATLEWMPAEVELEGGTKGTKLKVTVDSIEEGSIGDFDEVELEASQKGSTPYYMNITVEALDDVPASYEEEADLEVTAIDDRGQEQESVTFIGEFSRCEDAEQPKGMKAGESFESCMAYLIPGGGSIVEAQWRNGANQANGEISPYFEEPVIWGS